MIQDIISFTQRNQLCYLATIHNNKPKVRAIGLWYADNTGIYFQTSGKKEIYQQLVNTPEVEACFYEHTDLIGKMLRISGKVEFINETSFKEKALKDRPFLRDLGFSSESTDLILFRIAKGNAHFWTMQNNFKPKEYIEFNCN